MAAKLHGIVVDATPRWVEERLAALADQLLLPAPVLDGFLFLADDAFYAACTESIVSLQRAAKRIVLHLGLSCDTVICAFKSLPNPATIQRVGNDWFMEIDPQYKADGRALGAILAHEVCHILVDERGVPHFDTAVDEVHVDLAVMLAGLGALTLNAIETKSEVRGNTVYTQHRSFGYLRAPMMFHAYAHVCAAHGIGAGRATELLVASDARWSVRWTMTMRLRRPELSYKTLATNVIVPCASLACAKRLRMPTGRAGQATCPECKTTRMFDGRATRAIPREIAMTMHEAALPPRRPWFAKLVTARGLLVTALLGGVIAAGMFAKMRDAERASVGEHCRTDADCDSRLCLPMRDHTTVCTRACTADGQCPQLMRCDDAICRP